ncbi:Nucleoporin NUP120 [Neolecta irregularis DAH-3]|uniref:Nucleoporin NUP120 n=1 Tax=Neolecta irregularis (strain DAH-3) TaxID=1198029 RepID=A0A1U7LVZ0_NEOID|nr:Nucleoporin NUP120 [Neolecta irregularis DAH-3]|eukprot:OLL26712.1 Nucleoporin NUP120 [Neolecta irregularis DAH-3]
MCEDNRSIQLCEYPFVSLQDDVDEILQNKAEAVIDTHAHPNYHRILYAWRVKKSNYRGEAASIMHQRIKQLQNSTTGTHGYMMNSLEITESYLALISALSCLKDDDAWIIANHVEAESHTAKKPKFSHGLKNNIRRKLLTLKDLRQEYSAELARMRAMLSGPFPLA